MATKKVPMRMCVGCREMKPKRELIRIVRTVDNQIVLDSTGKRNGRGAYICRNPECFKKIKKSNALSRAFMAPVSDDIYERLETELETGGE
ncbi:MAG: RNase P modulator RnpM [Acutalibacteraceae bacterium]|jgi:predicted RNA-binding protein YlxR (DUF448 family)